VAKYAAWSHEFCPGAQAPADGVYELRNVLGSATGTRITLEGGQKLPAAPRGFTWRVCEPALASGASGGGIGRAARSAETD
jgi:hypothetical protein